jgi:hypothetical protein
VTPSFGEGCRWSATGRKICQIIPPLPLPAGPTRIGIKADRR